MKPRTRHQLAQAYELASSMLDIGYRASEIISELVDHCRASHGYNRTEGYYLGLATVRTKLRDDAPALLLAKWMRRASDALASEKVSA